MKKVSVPLIVCSPLLLAFAYWTLLNRAEPFMYQFYLLAWWAYIILLDAILALKTGRFFVLNKNFPHLLIMSVAFWCLFELVNLRLENWFYVNVPFPAGFRVSGYLLAFGTVIPAIYLTKELLCRLLPPIIIRPVSLPHYPAWAIPLGLSCLTLSLAFPTYFFGLAWIFLAFVVDGHNYRKGYGSFVRHLEEGSLTEVATAILSGMVCGFLWEFWNYWSVTKWVYTVPFFESLKVFEMPAPGYLGFGFFALETIAFVTLLHKSSFLTRFRWGTSFLALIFSLLCFFLIDRHTVFSYTAQVDQLPFLTEPTRQVLKARGIETSYGIDPGLLNQEERQRLAFLHMLGLGLRNFELLKEHGVCTVDQFSLLDENRVSSITGEKNMRRVRVYLKAARSHGSSALSY